MKNKSTKTNAISKIDYQYKQLLKKPIEENNQNVDKDILEQIQTLTLKTEMFLDYINEDEKNIHEFGTKIQEILSQGATLCTYIDDIYNEEIAPKNISNQVEFLKNKHKELEVQVYNFKFDELKRTFEAIEKNISEQKQEFLQEHEKVEKLEQKNEQILLQLNSIVSNLIGLIITFTIVATALSAIQSFKDFRYLPLFVVGLVFMGVTSTLISSMILSKKEKLNIVVIVLWGILLILFIITILGTIWNWFLL